MPKIPFCQKDYDALIAACSFLLRCDSYSFKSAKIDPYSAESALDVLIDESEYFDKEEMNAIFAAVVLSLRALTSEPHLFEGVSPDLVEKLSSRKEDLFRLLPFCQSKAIPSHRR